MHEQSDLFGGPPVIDKVWRNGSAWTNHALRIADEHLPHGEVMAEDFWLLPGIGAPADQHVKGQVVQMALQAGILRHLEPPKFAPSKRASNKGHRYEVYFRPGHPRVVRDGMPQWMR